MSKSPLFAWNLLLAVSLALAAAALLMAALAPPPGGASAKAKRLGEESKLVAETHSLREQEAASRSVVARYGWTGSQDQVESQAMALVTRLARSGGIHLGAFRPQKRAEQDGLARIGFLVNVEGPYPSVLRFLTQLETPTNRLAVHLVQLSSSDTASDAVSATIGLFAFQESKPATISQPAGSKARPVQSASNNPEAQQTKETIAQNPDTTQSSMRVRVGQ